MVVALLGGLVVGLALVVIVLVSSVGAVAGVCRQAAEEASQGTLPASSVAPGSPSFVSQQPSEEAVADIPLEYLSLYQSAAEEYGLDWAVLAAVGKIEGDHGRSGGPCAPSSAGARGPMQFIPSTWANAGVDGDGDGDEDVCDPADAIPGAANYLRLSGAPQDYQAALFAYNHAQWYVDDVLAQAESYRSAAGTSPDDAPEGEMAANGSFGGGSSGLAMVLAPLDLFAMSPAYAQDASGTVGSPGETDYSSVEIDALSLINDYRQKNGLSPLGLSDKLSTASAHYAHDMARYDAYGVPEPHISGPSDYYFEEATLTDRMNEEGYFAASYGENIAAGQAHAQQVFTAWRNSPGHNAMMLNPKMNVIGIGLVESPSTSYGEFWVTDFGSDADETTRPVSRAGGGSSSGDSGIGEGSNPSPVEGDVKAMFPLPDEYMDDYSDDWGASMANGGHEGADVMAPEGTPIYSITAGTVVSTVGSDAQGWDELGGWTTMIEATESAGPIQAGDTMYYAHQSEPSPLRPGDTVEAGDRIGAVGSTGHGPPGSLTGTPSHLHLGWYDPVGARAEAASGAMNPYPLLEWLRENGGTATGEGGVALGAASSDLPAYCEPLQTLGLVPGTGEPSGAAPSFVEANLSGEDSPAASGEAGEGSGTGQQVVEEAKQYIGVPYVLGGPEACVPGEQMDCTCLTTTVFEEFGYQLPDMPTDLMGYGEPVEGEPEAGDVLVWDDPGDGTGGHVAISMGDGQIIHANMGTMDTSITPMWDSPNYLGARRLVE